MVTFDVSLKINKSWTLVECQHVFVIVQYKMNCLVCCFVTTALLQCLVWRVFFSVRYTKDYFRDVRGRLCTHILYALSSLSTGTVHVSVYGMYDQQCIFE